MPDHRREPPDLRWDPFDVDIDVEPHGVWKRLRDEAPVYRNEEYDFWALSRFADVQMAHRNFRTFSSARGTVLELMGDDMSRTGQMIFMDPPEHERLRQLVSRAFTPRRVTELEDRIRQVCAEYLDPQVGNSGFDYVQEFGAQLPSIVISFLIGVPSADREPVRRLIDGIFHIEPGVGIINDVALENMIRLRAYFLDQLAERRRVPRDDMFTGLIEAEIAEEDGGRRRLTEDEAADFATLLVSAGTETVARLLGWAAVVLDDFPDERAVLAAEPEHIANAVEELLRYEAPSPVQGRWTTAEVGLHGLVIPADAKVLLLTGSAGRDDRAFPAPDRFDVRRRFDQHLSFGYGVHFCLGAALARLEGRIALEETLRRFPSWEVDRQRAVRLHTSTVRGYKEVPISI